MRIVCRPGFTAYSTRGACSRGFAGADRRVAGRLGLACTGTRTVSTEGAGSWERGAGMASGSLFRFSSKYPPTPAATTASPITAGARERGLRDFAAGGGGRGGPAVSGGGAGGGPGRRPGAPPGLGGGRPRPPRPPGGGGGAIVGG